MSFRRLLLGRRLANREQAERTIGALEGVPAMGLDGLGSAAYGPEAALTILLPLGAAGLAAFGPILGAILALLAILFASCWQTIKAYPSSGGAHLVSKVNLGTRASLVAAAALMVDYAVATPAHTRALPRDPGLDRAGQPARNASQAWSSCSGRSRVTTISSIRACATTSRSASPTSSRRSCSWRPRAGTSSPTRR
jgi:hypothetical protein